MVALRSPGFHLDGVNMRMSQLLPKTSNKNSPEVEGLVVLQRLMNYSSNLVESAKTISVASSSHLCDVAVAAITTFEKRTEKKSA